MIRTLLLLYCFAAPALASYQSLTIPANASVKLAIPSGAPFTSMGNYRLSMRLHDWTVPISGSIPVFNSVNANIRVALFANNVLCGANYGADIENEYSNWECVNISGMNDVVLRLQRFGATYPSDGASAGSGSTVFEVQNLANGQMLTSYCGYDSVGGNQFPCPISAATPTSDAGSATFGGTASYSLAWLKWFGTTVPPGSPLENESTPADLADFRFEGNYTNQGTAGYAVTLGTQSGSPSFTASRVEPPNCYVQRQIFRAGQAAQLANYSYALDTSGTIKYLWQQLSGPTRLSWSAQNTAQPAITGGVFGSYILQLTLTDGTGHTSACSIKDGFVATDLNGVQVNANPLVDLLLGPQIQLGKNPWGWYDDRHLGEAAIQIPNLVTYYNGASQYWNVPGPGTITTTNNSYIITGSGTSFTTTFCQGPASPTLAKPAAKIIIWYPQAALPAGTGRRVMYVASCQSDTQLTLASGNGTWNAAGQLSQGSGWNYTYTDDTQDSAWISNSAAPNFYDAVAAFYSLYYRSGIDDYLNAARTLADNFWQYRMDSGRNYLYGENFSTFPRNHSLLGMVLRAFDGRPDMWSGLELVFASATNTFHAYIQAYGPWKQNGLPGDPREYGYLLAEVGYCALTGSNATMAASCRSELAEVINNGFTSARDAVTGEWWDTLYYQGSGGGSTYDSWNSRTSVSLTNGSTTATCVDGIGTCSWNSAMLINNINGTNYTTPWWFTNNPAVAPTSNRDGDSVAYYPIFVDSHHLTLHDMNGNPAPYQGSTGSHG